MQHRTCIKLFLESTGLHERSIIVIFKKIATVLNNTRSRSFHEYWWLERLRMAMDIHVAMLAMLPCYWTVYLRYYVYLVTVIPLVNLSASRHCYSTFANLLTPRRLTFNLTHTISYSSNGTHVVIYIPVFVHWRYSIVSWSLQS